MSLRYVIILLINLYQKFISPRKNFRCAYHAYHGKSTCSGFGKRAISKYGVVSGFRILNRRFAACSIAAKAAEEEAPKDENTKKKQQKECAVLHGVGEIACCSFLSVFG